MFKGPIKGTTVDDQKTQKALDEIRTALPPASVLDGARLLEDIQFTAGVTRRVVHGLKRKPRGYLVVRIDRGAAMAYFYDEQRSHTDTDVYLYLRFEGISPIASILVF